MFPTTTGGSNNAASPVNTKGLGRAIQFTGGGPTHWAQSLTQMMRGLPNYQTTQGQHIRTGRTSPMLPCRGVAGEPQHTARGRRRPWGLPALLWGPPAPPWILEVRWIPPTGHRLRWTLPSTGPSSWWRPSHHEKPSPLCDTGAQNYGNATQVGEHAPGRV